MSHRSFDHDVDALHGDAAPRRGVAVDDKEAAATGRARSLRGVALHVHRSGHHVFGDTLPGVTVEHDRRLFVHSPAVIANVSLDLDGDRRVDTGSDRMLPARIKYPPMGFIGIGAQAMECTR